MFDDKYYELKYSFISGLDDYEASRFITTYNGKIYECSSEDDTEVNLIGKFIFKHIAVGSSLNFGVNLFAIMDEEQELLDLGEELFDLEEGEINEDIQEFYNDEILNLDFGIIDRIEIKETHRGLGIGRKLIKDIYRRFASSCGLIIAKVIPLQFESNSEEDRSNWAKDLNYKALERDEEKAFYKLKAYYKNLGFKHIEGYENYMFMNMAFRNLKLEEMER